MDDVIIFGAEYLWIVAVLVGFAYFIFITGEKKKRIVLLALSAFPFTYIVAKGIALFYYNPQPFVVGDFVPLIPHVADNGFPSDHTLLVAALASVIFLHNRFVGIVLFLVAIAVGFSRVFAGLHHTIDVVGSIGIAIVVTYIAYVFLKRTLSKKEKTPDSARHMAR